MERIQECAGNLLAELYDAKFEFDHGRMTQADFLSRVEVLRSKGRYVRERYCQQPILHFEEKREVHQAIYL